MRSRVCLSLVCLALACGGPLKTGGKSHPADASPPEEPACPNDYGLCGPPPSTVCTDLRNDPAHCGSCGKACAPGVACVGAVCQRVVCQGQPLVSGTAMTGTPTFDSYISGTELADVNGDGQRDLVIWRVETTSPDGSKRKGGPSSFSISLGQPGGRFASPQNYAIDGVLRQVQGADINHDGVDDLILLKMGQPCLELWLGHTDGPPTPGPEIPGLDCGTSWVMLIADISGDGNLDLVAGRSPGSVPSELLDRYTPRGTLDLYLSDGTGTFRFSRSYPTLFPAYNLIFKDWNGDGFPDLVAVGPRGYRPSRVFQRAHPVRAKKNQSLLRPQSVQ